MNKMKERKERKESASVRRRKKDGPSRFERELRKLECSINYCGETMETTFQDPNEYTNSIMECSRGK